MSSPEVGSLQVVGGRYALEVSIGRGGMGEVWRAKHIALNSHVAIKLLHGALASERRTRQRFLKEAQLTAQLKTRHAVQVFDFGVTDEGIPYLVMELLDGETLDQRLTRMGRLAPEATVRILRPAGRALDRAHQLGIIHRDFKPENLFIVADEEGVETVKVVDFGIAKLVGELEVDTASAAAPEGRQILSTFTRTATLVGTPYYMGPEQIRPHSVLTPAVDIWALGIVAFECLTGRRPFDADDLAVLFHRIERLQYPRATDLVPELPPAFDSWFEQACSVYPEARFPTAHEAIEQLSVALGVNVPFEGTRDMSAIWTNPPPPMQASGTPEPGRAGHVASGIFTPTLPKPSNVPTLSSVRRRWVGPWFAQRLERRPWLKPLAIAAAAAAIVVLVGLTIALRARSRRIAHNRQVSGAGLATSLTAPSTAESPAIAAAQPVDTSVRPEALPLVHPSARAEKGREAPLPVAVHQDPPPSKRAQRSGKPGLASAAAPEPGPPPVVTPAPAHSSPFSLPPLGL